MSCSHRKPDAQSNVINLSQLNCSKSACSLEEGTCQLCHDVLAVGDEIREALERLKELINHQQHLKTKVNNTHSPIIRDLPVEILSKIFYECISEKMPTEDWELTRQDFLVPLMFGAVCHTWRQVAWSSPELWTTIFIRRLYSSATDVCNQYSMVEGWIERSRSLPISVCIVEDAVDDSDIEDAVGDANIEVIPEGCHCWEVTLQLLTHCCDRWQNATLNLSKNSFEYIASNLKLRPPTRRLEFGSDERWPPTSPNNEPLQLWEESDFGPGEITLLPPVLFNHFTIDWKHVTQVDVQGWSPGACANLLKNAPQLASCSFMAVGHFGRDSQLPSHVQPVIVFHTSLRRLSFECGEEELVSFFFDYVTLPSLDEFNYSYLYCRFAPDVMENPFLLSFFRRSNFPLTRLTLVMPTLRADYLLSLLNLVPSLIHLCVKFSGKAMHFFLQHLAAPPAFPGKKGSLDIKSAFLLPQLETLEVGYSFLIPWGSLPNVFGYPLELGAEGRRPLKSFVLALPGIHIPGPVTGLSAFDIERLTGLQEVGMTVNYRAYGSTSLVPVTFT